MSYYQKYLLYKSKYLLYQGGTDTENTVNIHFENIDGSSLPIFNGQPDTSILDILKFIRKQTGKNITSIGLVLSGKDIVYNSKFRKTVISEITDKNNIVFYLMYGRSEQEKLENLIKDFPPDISVKTDWLEEDILVGLDLADNGLNEIPETIGTLENLEKLDLSDNNLTRIPDNLGELEDLRDLNLSSNQLKNIPDKIGNLSNLEILDVSFNDLVALPDSIGNLSKLRMLYMYDNKNINGLPKSLDNLSNLEDIKIGDYDSY